MKKEDKSLEEICRLYRFPDKAVKLLQELIINPNLSL